MRADCVLRQRIDEGTVLLVAAGSDEAERELRSSLRELGERLAGVLGAAPHELVVGDPVPSRAATPARRRTERLSAHLPTGLPRRRLLGMLAEHALRMTGADGVAIADHDEAAATVRVLLTAGTAIASRDDVSFPASSSVWGEALRDARPVIVDDYRRHELAHPLLVDAGLRSLVTVPITVDGRAVGTIDAYTVNRPQRFGSSQLAVLEVLAQQAGALITQDRLYHELESSYRATVEALTNALAVKDTYTSEHVREIAELALELGRGFRLGARRMRDLEYAAILHDIGKIGVPTHILTKPGPLDETERALVERHTETGHALLRDIPFLARVAEIVRACHERWDGAGYPDGLAGERIPLEARIIFVCDTWHAMRSDRPYRAALDAETARGRLRAAAGTQLDPRVVDAFLRSGAAR